MKKLASFILKTIPRHQLHSVAPVFLKIISLFYRGKRFEDPITGITYRKLLPYGRVKSRKNALAPDSISLERHRLFWLYLKQKTKFFEENLKVLHVAPEYCFLDRFGKMKNLDYTTGDLNSPWADVKFDAHNIPFEDNSFDVIFANHLLEHVENDIKVMQEFYRLIKPGGWGIFMVPMDVSRKETYEDPTITDPKEREKHFWQDDHVRLYGLDYPDRLASVGFEVVRENFIETLGDELATRYCLPKKEPIYLCKKPL